MSQHSDPIRIRRRTAAWAAVSLALGLAACGGTELELAPDVLVGTWTTDAPAYAERAFEIWDDGIVLWTGDGDLESHVLNSIHRWDDDDGARYRLKYRDSDGGLQDFEFVHEAATGVIRIRNQPDIEWRRTGPVTSADAIR